MQLKSLSNIPEGLRDLEKMMLHATPELRPDAHQFTKVCSLVIFFDLKQ